MPILAYSRGFPRISGANCNDPAVSAQVRPLRHRPQRGSSCPAPGGASAVVELDTVSDHPHCVLLGLEAVPVDTLLLQDANDALDHAVLLRAVLCNELLIQSIVAYLPGGVSAGEDRAVVRT